MPAFHNPLLGQSLEWQVTDNLIAYPDALLLMEARVKAIQTQQAPELVWLLEHPSLYTLGTSAKATDVLSQTIPAFTTGRGGEVTYHGPGQRVAYVMLNLQERLKDIRAYVWHLEEWLMQTLADFDISAERRAGRVGLWVAASTTRDEKIAAIGIRVSRWVTYHGVALNINPDLSYFQDIIPCGIRNHGVTSMHKLGCKATLTQVDERLHKNFKKIFG